MADDTDSAKKHVIPPNQQRKSILTLLVVIIVILVVGVGIGMLLSSSTKASARDTLAKAAAPAEFPVYYPVRFPKGFAVRSESINVLSNQSIQFTASAGNDRKIIVTQQSKPKNTEELPNDKKLITPIGPAFITPINNRLAGFIFADKTLISISSIGDVSIDQLELLMQNMSTL